MAMKGTPRCRFLYPGSFWLLTLCLSVEPGLASSLLSCEATSPDASGYPCHANGRWNKCKALAVLRTNSHFSSLQNLTLYLGLQRSLIARANGLSAASDQFLPDDLQLLIPIKCQCVDGFFQADVIKTCVEGDSFYGIAESLQGLTTCKAIKDSNPGIQPVRLASGLRLLVPLRCSCASSTGNQTRLVSYPVREGDTISKLASKFGISSEAIISANNRSNSTLQPLTTVLIPIYGELVLAKLRGAHNLYRNDQVLKKKNIMWIPGIYIAAMCGLLVMTIVVTAFVFVIIHRQKKKKKCRRKNMDSEFQHLGLSIRTNSEKKISFQGSQNTMDTDVVDGTPQTMNLESYSMEDLRRATNNFSSGNHIEGSVYHGRLNGKDLAVKKITPDAVGRIEFSLFQGTVHRHPNIVRLLGTSVADDSDPYFVFEFAANGSLKDWLHGGLAIKNQFIASCYRFLTWNQRLQICRDVAMALQYMHQVITPPHIHGDVKSRNIFLDENFKAKIGNFGMGKPIADETKDRDFCSTDPASWSHGYLAPEFIRQPVSSPCIDIFAYGVVLLEVISGRTPITKPNYRGEGYASLSEKMKSNVISENGDGLGEWMDDTLGNNYTFESALALANLARSCVADDPSFRPNAGDIVDCLTRLVEEAGHDDDGAFSESSSEHLVRGGAYRFAL